MQLSSQLLAEYASELSFDDLPDSTIEQTKRLVLDSVATSVGAFASPPSKHLRTAYGDRTATDRGATVFGTGRVVPLEYAALINGAMVRYLDFNDCYISGTSVCHPSDHVPPLLAVAEAEDASGEELIEAIVVAYEIMCRGVDTGVVWENGFDYVTWGLYSGAAAAGKLIGLSEDALVDAIGIAGTAGTGLLISRLGEVSMWKGVAQSYAIHTAIQACQMARAGLTGPTRVFDGEGGFFENVSDGPVEFEALGGRDDEPFRIERTNIKPFACGYFMQAPISAVLDILSEHDIDPDAIEQIEIQEFEQAVQVLAGEEKWSTDLTRETADHSIPYTIAVAILDGEVGPRQYRPDRLNDPEVHELMRKVVVTESDDLTRQRRESPGDIPAIASVTTGTDEYRTHVDYPIGHWKDPMDREVLEGKFEGLASSYLTDEQVTRVIESCDELDGVDDLRALADLLRV